MRPTRGLPEEFGIIEICKAMGWTYDEYMSQPDWFIQAIILKMTVESDYKRIKTKQAKIRNK